MKFIGQYIQKFIARFRNDVYLEDISTGTIASGSNLGLDSNNKIVKSTGVAGAATEVTVTDNENTAENNLITFVANAASSTGVHGLEMDGDLTYNPSTGKVTAIGFIGSLTGNVTGNVSGTAATVTAAAQPNITSINNGTSSTTTIAGTLQTATNSTSSLGGAISLSKTTSDTVGPAVTFSKTRGGNACSNNDEVGRLKFSGANSAASPIQFAEIISTIANVTNADERGKLELKVANDGTLRNGITMIGSDTAEEVDVTIGNGTDSATTIAGDLTVTGNVSMGRLTATLSGSTLAGHVSVGDEDGSDNFHIARYSSSFPYAHIRCGENNVNRTTGFQVVTKNGSTHQEAFTITGNTRAATFKGNVSTDGTLTAAGNITANGNIVGDNHTNITNISTVTADNVVGSSIVDSIIISGRVKGNAVGTSASSLGGVCEVITYGTVYAGGNLTAGKVYYLTEDSSTSGAVSWRETNATSGISASGLLAVALGTTPGQGMLLRGTVVIDSSVLPNSTPGRTLFLKTSGGGIEVTPPNSTGNIQRIVGHYIQTMATSNHSLIHFNPSQEFIEIA